MKRGLSYDAAHHMAKAISQGKRPFEALLMRISHYRAQEEAEREARGRAEVGEVHPAHFLDGLFARAMLSHTGRLSTRGSTVP